MAKSDVEKYPAILHALEKFLTDEGCEANDDDWDVLPKYDDPDFGKVRPFTVKTKCGKTAAISLSDKVAEYRT